MKSSPKAFHEVDALVTVAVATLVEHRPHHREGHPLMDNPEHRDIDVERAEAPVGAV